MRRIRNNDLGRKRGRPSAATAGSLKDLFTRGLDGGLTVAIEYLQAASDSDNDTARKFLDQWRKVPVSRRANTSWEVVCAQANIKPWDVAGVVIWWAQQHATNVAKLKALTALPDVVGASLTSARALEGFQDRKLILESQKFVERGPGIVIDNSQTTTEQHVHLPSLEEALALPSAKPRLALTDAVEGELVENES